MALPRRQNAPEALKWTHQGLQMATPRSQKRPTSEGVALEIIDVLINLCLAARLMAHGQGVAGLAWRPRIAPGSGGCAALRALGLQGRAGTRLAMSPFVD